MVFKWTNILTEYFQETPIWKYCPHSGLNNQLWIRRCTVIDPQPPTLLMFVKRNTINPITGKTMKKNDEIIFDSMDFKLPNTVDENVTYTMTGTISHLGKSTKSGHYIAFIPDTNRKFFIQLNDDKLYLNQTLKQAGKDLCAMFARKVN